MAMDEQLALAAEALVRFGGCARPRAEALAQAAAAVGAEEALDVTIGNATVFGGLADTRVERLHRLIGRLAAQAEDEETQAGASGVAVSLALPSQFELAAMWRITPAQAQRVLRTWRARHPELYEDRMGKLASNGDATAGGSDQDPTVIVEYSNPEVLEYAESLARRRGLSKGLKADRSKLSLEVPESTLTPDGKSLKQVLGIDAS